MKQLKYGLKKSKNLTFAKKSFNARVFMIIS